MKLTSHLYIKKSLLFEYLLVIIAFSTMVFMGSIFCTRIVGKNIADYGDEVINASAETLKTYLKGHEITLDDIAYSVEKSMSRTRDVAAVRRELVLWTQWLQRNDIRFNDFLYVYGVVDDEFIDGAGWVYPDDYVPESRVWYVGASQLANGGTFYSEPYVDAHTGENVMTISRRLYDDNGDVFGVLALDVFMSSISEYISHMKLMNSGYGLLLDSEMHVIVNQFEDTVGKYFYELDGMGGDGYVEMAEKLASGEDVSAFSYLSVSGKRHVGFLKKLFNGWYIGVSSPYEVYYSDVRTMQLTLALTGLVLGLLFCGVLTFLHIAKDRSDEASKVKSSFLANMSHEIRTPMNAVIGMAELLTHESLNPRQMRYVNDISTSARSLLSIINDILDLSKIESGKLVLSPVNYDFRALLDNISSMFKFVAQQRNVEFRFEGAVDLPKILYGDDIRLRQVLTNVCGNAVKFTEHGYVRLKVTASGGKLTFEIKDTGIGVHKEDIPNLFNAFEQAQSSKNRSIVGTGLGLAISKAFVEMMGGGIAMESEFGRGTVVTVTLPYVEGDAGDVQRESERKTDDDQTIFAPDAKVLIVDDNEFNLTVASGLLELFQIKAETVNSGKKAIGLISKNQYDVVFMDHMMPEMDGIEAAREIRGLGAEYRDLPIIALTANAIHGAKEMFLANGFNGFISKPIDIRELTEMLAEFLPVWKILHKSEIAPVVERRCGFADALEAIDAINVEVGLSRVSGIEGMYRDNMKLFHRKLGRERAVMASQIDNGDISGFAISVHSMKSILSTVGALGLSDRALGLETAAKNGDADWCREYFTDFHKSLLALEDDLSAAFPEWGGAGSVAGGESANGTDDAEAGPYGVKKGDELLLAEIVQKALAAADDYDNDAGFSVMQALLDYDFGESVNSLLAGAMRAFEEYDCDKAAENLRNIA